MALDERKLPEVTTQEKGNWYRRGIIFGTIAVKGKDVPYKDWVENECPNVSEIFSHHRKFEEKLPEGCKGDFTWYSDDYNVASFQAYTVSMPLELKAFKGKNGIPWVIGFMLADYLQLGGHFNFRNFNNYRFGKNLKFLPLVIKPDCLLLHVYPLTMKQIEATMFQFGAIEQTIRPLLSQLDEILKSVYALVRLDEIATQSSIIDGAVKDIQDRLEPVLTPFKKKLGFLYKELKGKQDVREFYYEMLAKK